jgi:hypothetical protein
MFNAQGRKTYHKRKSRGAQFPPQACAEVQETPAVEGGRYKYGESLP